MARRGKAATRQARQRRAQRPSTTTPPRVRPPDEQAAVTEASATAATVEPVRAPAAPASRSRGDRMWRPEVSSQLSERALAEYHYVGRDLRNIGQAAALMAGLLLVVFILVRVMGIGPG